jgi:hypothetical protein
MSAWERIREPCTILQFQLEQIQTRPCIFLRIVPPVPIVLYLPPDHFFVSQASLGFIGRPCGWWYISAVLMHRGWQSLSALRSESRECPRRMGVGMRERRGSRYVCTSSRVVVTEESEVGVMPGHLGGRTLVTHGGREAHCRVYLMR